MTDSSAASEPADFSVILAERTRVETAERGRNIRRSIAAVAVLAVHVLAIVIFIYSSRIILTERIRAVVPEAILWFVLPPKPAEPDLVHPQISPAVVPELAAPITLPPIPARALPVETPTDGLLGVGRSLACGASSYEYLSPGQRAQCVRHPWNFTRRPNGTIVLDVPKLIELPPPAIDVARHNQQTAPPCPILTNVPCLGKIMHGDPLGGGPSPF